MHPLQQKILGLAKTQNLGKLSLRQIGELIGEENYPQKVKHHLMQLEKKNLIKIEKGKGIIRTIEKGLDKVSGLFSIPILGCANCGEAMIYADELAEGHLKLSKRFLEFNKKNNIFTLKTIGDSMNRATVGFQKLTIDDGDYVIIDGDRRSPTNGDYVLSIIDGCANIKKYLLDLENKQVILISESTLDIPPIHIHLEDNPNYLINGTVISVIKKPKK